MELAFETRSLRDLCENEERAQHSLGARVAEKLKRRIADLRAATTVKDVVAGGPHEVAGKPYGHIEIDLSDGYRIELCSNHSVVPVFETGGVDWSRVSRVRILRIGN